MPAIPNFWKKCSNFNKCKRHCATKEDKCYWCKKENK